MLINKPCYKILSAIWANKTFPPDLIILLICMSSVTILYKVFFFFSPIIWSMNKEIPLEDLTPIIRVALQRDGIETYCLYILVLACIPLSFFILSVYRILLSRAESFTWKILHWFLLFSLLLNACLFLGNIGFYPPMFCAILNWWVCFSIFIVSIIVYFLFKLSVRFAKISILAVSVILIPVCFIATKPIYLVDYSYIFAPALRMIHHFKLSEIYFQYDMLLSLLAALWMKLDLDLNYFQILGQFSVYLLLLISFFFSRRLFFKKELSFYLLAALVLIKIYALLDDPVACFQVTPLRLDWWLLLLVLAYEKGLYSKWIGLTLGILIVFHRTFGIIYAVGYLETVLLMLFLDYMKNALFGCSLKATIKKHLRYNIGNIVIIALSLGIGAFVFGSSLEGVAIYRKIGIGFMKISKISFYWYVPVMLSVTSIYLVRLRGKLPDGYFATGAFLIFLAIGNSIYFFGRSHENNIINISGSLIFSLFMLFDLLVFRYKCTRENNTLKRLSVAILPNISLLLLMFYYSGKIYQGTAQKLDNIRNFQFIYPISHSFDTKQIRELTNRSPNVYFVGEYDFYYYYYGGYVPQGRFSPYSSWIYKKNLVDFLQALIDRGYYIVFLKEDPNNPRVNPNINGEVLSALKYNEIVEKYGFKVIRK